MNWVDLLSWILLGGGGFFCIVGGVGMLRLPDFFTRCHGAGITDTMGAGMVLLGLMVQAGDPLVAAKLLLLLLFILLTSPVAGHALVKAAYAGGMRIEQPVENHTGKGEQAALDSLDSRTEEAPTVMVDPPEEDA